MVNDTQQEKKTPATQFYDMGVADGADGAVTRYFSSTMFDYHADWQNYLAGLRDSVA